jgi:hypothetical protein
MESMLLCFHFYKGEIREEGASSQVYSLHNSGCSGNIFFSFIQFQFGGDCLTLVRCQVYMCVNLPF